MKKIFALLLCCALLAGLLAACGSGDGTAPPFVSPSDIENAASAGTEASEIPAASDATDAADEMQSVYDDSVINYKGLSGRSATLEDVKAVEGRDPDFEFTANEVTYYVYNDVTMDDLTFSQVQFSFSENNVRVSCTSSTQTNPEETVALWNTAISARYGAPSESGGNYTWSDGSGNYITLCALNETTAQLAFYLCR